MPGGQRIMRMRMKHLEAQNRCVLLALLAAAR
jgi:hypothetical protein